jgi:hypothetical protein
VHWLSGEAPMNCHQAVLGAARAERGRVDERYDVRAVGRVVERERVRPRQLAIALRIERLERADRDGLRREADPHVAVAHDLVARECPADIEVELVRKG